MIPSRFKLVMEYLTRAKKVKPDLPDVFPASQAPMPPKKESLKTMEAINQFVLRNPRQDMAGGGRISLSNGGIGQGKRPPSPTTQKFLDYVKGLNKRVLATKTLDQLIKESGVNIKKDTASKQLNLNNPNLKYKKLKPGVLDPQTKKKILELAGTKKNKRVEIIQKINDWTNDWFKNNAGKYNSYDKAKTQLIKDWKKESKNKIYSGSNYKLSLENGLPNIAAKTGVSSTGTAKVSDTIFDLKFPVARANKELIFQKGYVNYRLQDPRFNKKINDYFDLVILDKRGFNTQQELIQAGQLKEGFGLVRTETGTFTKAGSRSIKGRKILDALNIDREVLDFITTYLKPNSEFFATAGGENIYDIIRKHVDPEKVLKYRTKITIGGDRYRDNLREVVKLANKGLPPTKQLDANLFLAQMRKEAQKMAKLFNLKDLPPELKFFGYSQDHLLGIREALELGDPKIARQTLKTMAGTTRAQNTFLGFKEFGNERRSLINQFNAASISERGPIIKKLNDLTEKFMPGNLEYGVRKDGSMKVKVLNPQTTFKARKESYISELKKAPPDIKNTIASLGGGACGRILKYQGGRIGLQDGTPNVDVCFRNGINRINQGLPNATPAEARNFTKVLRAGRNILKFGIVPEALFIGAESLFRVGLGDSPKEALLRASEYILPGDQTDRAEVLKVARTKGPENAAIVERALKYKNELGNIQNLEAEKELADILSPTSEFDYFPDRAQDIKNIEQRILEQKQNMTKINEAQLKGAERIQQEAFDISKAKAPLTKLKSFARDLEYDDPLSSDFQRPQQIVDTNLFPSFRADMETANVPELTVRRYFEQNPQDGNAEDFINYQNMLKNQTLSQAEQTYNPEELYGASGLFFGQPIMKTQPPVRNTSQDINPFQAAGGGIAKLAGVDSGPPPASGPNSQGLQGLMKRVKRI